MPDNVPEAYDIGHGYAKYTSSLTPGEKHYNPNFQGGPYKPSNHNDNLININADKDMKPMNKKVDLKDIEEWVSSKETIDKYKERYGDEWKSKIDEVYNKMFNKVVETKNNIVESRIKEFERDLTTLSDSDFITKHNKEKEVARKEIQMGSILKTFKEFEELDKRCDECSFEHEKEGLMESEYQGKKVKLNDPFRTPGGPKKFAVYVNNEKGNVVKVTFGDPNMEIKRDDPDRRRNFRARHNCDNPGPKWKARYWSCYQWRAGAKVEN